MAILAEFEVPNKMCFTNKNCYITVVRFALAIHYIALDIVFIIALTAYGVLYFVNVLL